jgi:hypothetical protein
MVGERAQEQLVEHTAVIDAGIRVDESVAPVCQRARVVVVRVEPIATDERNGIGQHSTRRSVRRRQTGSRSHRQLGVFDHQTRVDFDLVRVVVQMPQLLLHVLVARNVLECAMRLQVEVLSELIQRTQVPGPRLLDTEYLDGAEDSGDSIGTERVCAVFDTGRQNVDQVVIGQCAVCVPLDVCKLPL